MAETGRRAYVLAVHTEVLARRGETLRWMSAADGASGDRVLASLFYVYAYFVLRCCIMFTDVEEFLTKKAELNDLQLKRQHQIYVSSGQLPVVVQQVWYIISL